jgi:hypothetical protein
MNQKNILLSTAAIFVIVSMIVSTTQITKIAYADRDEKEKTWVGENSASESSCGKPDGCKTFKDVFGDPLNKFTKKQCESNSDTGKCKQAK